MNKEDIEPHALIYAVQTNSYYDEDTRIDELEDMMASLLVGSGPYMFKDRTLDLKKICANAVINLCTSVEAACKAVRNWCVSNDIMLVEKEDLKKFKPKASGGLYAVMSPKGISCIVECTPCAQVAKSWRVGGLWAGHFEFKEGVFLDHIDVPDFPEDFFATEELKARAYKKIGSFCDTSSIRDIIHLPQHTEGPEVQACLNLPREKILEFLHKPCEVSSPSILPWGLFVMGEFITVDNWQEFCNERAMATEGMNWRTFVKFIFNQIPDSSVITAVDLHLAK